MDRGGAGPVANSLATGETVSTGGLGRAAATPANELAPGTMVGEYRIEGQLGEGGMGCVYAAVHPVIAKRAAIKVLRPELSVNREAVERFIQEARSVNQIGHPNIIDIFSLGSLPDGRCYFVMELLRGESLRQRLCRGPLPVIDALAILETITVALEAAHDNGIVHRDLKPDNVFLVDVKGDAPQVKLLDFGIAKLLGQDGALTERTRTGNLLGTPAYMSPEQARGYAVDRTTDVYALGAMTFELLTGSMVFPAESPIDMIAKHLNEQPRPLRALNPQAPAALDAIVARMLAKLPHARPTLAEARAVFRECRVGMEPGAAVEAPPRAAVTPAPGMSSSSPHAMTPPAMAPPAVVPVETIVPVTPRRRSRAWGIAIAAMVLVGAGVGVLVAGRQYGQHATAPASRAAPPTPPASESATPPEPAAAAPPATDPAPAPVAPPPVGDAPPSGAAAPSGRLTDDEPARKPIRKHRKHSRASRKNDVRPAYNDDDAPM